LVQQFADAPATERLALVDGIIFAWLGVDDVQTGSRGRYIDARQLSALEVFSGSE